MMQQLIMHFPPTQRQQQQQQLAHFKTWGPNAGSKQPAINTKTRLRLYEDYHEK
jgi:hypothetical protein